MNAKRYNPCAAIRNALHNGGYSTVKVTNAVNSALGELTAKSVESKLGDGRISKTSYSVTEATTTKFTGDLASLPLRFDAWCCAVAKAEKIASFETIQLPGIFVEWLKFAKTEAKDLAKEVAATAAQ